MLRRWRVTWRVAVRRGSPSRGPWSPVAVIPKSSSLSSLLAGLRMRWTPCPRSVVGPLPSEVLHSTPRTLLHSLCLQLVQAGAEASCMIYATTARCPAITSRRTSCSRWGREFPTGPCRMTFPRSVAPRCDSIPTRHLAGQTIELIAVREALPTAKHASALHHHPGRMRV